MGVKWIDMPFSYRLLIVLHSSVSLALPLTVMTMNPSYLSAPKIMRSTIQSMRPMQRHSYHLSLRTAQHHTLTTHLRPHDAQKTATRHQNTTWHQMNIVRPAKPFHRAFSTTPVPAKDHHFDTLKFTQRLTEQGLSDEQAQALMKVLSAVLEESIQNLTRTMVPREDALKTAYTQKIDFNALRTELLQSDTSESTLTKTTHDRLQNEVAKLGQRLRDEVERTKSGVKLDLNLEKGRVKDEREAMEMKIRETETRIEQEVAALQERVAGVKFDTVRWLAGVVTGTMALLLGAWRLFM